MVYREPDEAGRRRSEIEIAAREDLELLVAEGRARRALVEQAVLAAYHDGKDVEHARVAASRDVVAPRRRGQPIEPMSWREVKNVLRALHPAKAQRLIRRISAPDLRPRSLAKAAVGTLAGTLLLAPALPALAALGAGATAALFLGAATASAAGRSARERRLRAAVTWLRVLPFPVEGFLELLAARSLHGVSIRVTGDLPPDLLAVLPDLLARIDAPGRPTLAGYDGDVLVLQNARPAATWRDLRRWLPNVVGDVLVPLHWLHAIRGVAILPR